MFNDLQISEALLEASQSIKMDDKLAFETLKTVLASQNMSTNVDFTPSKHVKILKKAPVKFITSSLITMAVSGAMISYYSYVPNIKDVQTIDNSSEVKIVVSLDNNFGVKEVYAISSEGTIIAADKVANDFIISIAENGEYTLKVVNGFNEVKEESIIINTVDNTGPVIDSYENEDNLYTFNYSDENGIDLSSAYGIGENGKFKPVKNNGNSIVYEYLGSSFRIFISDSLGNISEYVVTKQ